MMRLNRHVHRCLNLKILSGIQCSDKPLKSFPFLEYAGIFQDTGEFFAEFFFQNGIDFLSIGHLAVEDRKSTRLNSSHVSISYAVFCLKKKKYSYVLLEE